MLCVVCRLLFMVWCVLLLRCCVRCVVDVFGVVCVLLFVVALLIGNCCLL